MILSGTQALQSYDWILIASQWLIDCILLNFLNTYRLYRYIGTDRTLLLEHNALFLWEWVGEFIIHYHRDIITCVTLADIEWVLKLWNPWICSWRVMREREREREHIRLDSPYKSFRSGSNAAYHCALFMLAALSS